MGNRSSRRREGWREQQPGEWPRADPPGDPPDDPPDDNGGGDEDEGRDRDAGERAGSQRGRFGIWPLALRRVLARRCPQCGRGRLFQSWAQLCERCDVCGLVYRREPGGELGAMYLSATVNQAFAALVFLVIWLGTEWSLALSLAVGVPIVLVFCYAFLPWSMGLWTAVEYAHDVGSGEWWARPRQ